MQRHNIRNFVIPPGAQTLATFIITYELCNGGTVASCSSSLYKTTGSAIQSVSPSGTSLYSVNFQVSGSAGANSGHDSFEWGLLS